jgi:hypothetical protein
MTAMDSVENADGQEERAMQVVEFRYRSQNFHC